MLPNAPRFRRDVQYESRPITNFVRLLRKWQYTPAPPTRKEGRVACRSSFDASRTLRTAPVTLPAVLVVTAAGVPALINLITYLR